MPAAERNFSILRHGNAVSFTKTLDKGCPPGSSIEIIAKTLKIRKRHIVVRLIAFDDTALILTVPIGKEGKVTAAGLVDGNPTSELEKRASLPRDKKFTLELKFTKFAIEIIINKILLLEFIHRVEPESITELHIDGPLKLEEVVLTFPQDGQTGVAASQSDSTRELEGAHRASPYPLTPEPAAVQTGIPTSSALEDPPPSYEADMSRNTYIPSMYPVAFFTPMGILIQQPSLGDPAIAAAFSEQIMQVYSSYPTQNILTSQVEERRNIGRNSTSIISTETAANLTNLFISICHAIEVTPNTAPTQFTWSKTFNTHSSAVEENPQIVSALQNIDLQVQVINREAPALMSLLKRIYSEHANGRPSLSKRSSSRSATTTMSLSLVRSVTNTEEVQDFAACQDYSRTLFDSACRPARPAPPPPPRSRSLNFPRIENNCRRVADGSNSSILCTSVHENIVPKAQTSTPTSQRIMGENYLRSAPPDEAEGAIDRIIGTGQSGYGHEDLSRFETPILTGTSSANKNNTSNVRRYSETREVEISNLIDLSEKEDVIQQPSSVQGYGPSHRKIPANEYSSKEPFFSQNGGEFLPIFRKTPDQSSLTKCYNNLSRKSDQDSERLENTASVAYVTNSSYFRNNPELQCKASALVEDLKKRISASQGNLDSRSPSISTDHDLNKEITESTSEIRMELQNKLSESDIGAASIAAGGELRLMKKHKYPGCGDASADVPLPLRSPTSSAESGSVSLRESRVGSKVIAIEIADIREMISKQQ